MADRLFDINVNLNSNRLLGLALEAFDNLSLPVTAVESRFAFHSIIKVPIYYDGSGWQEVASKSYVNQVLEGLAWKDDIKVATTGNVTIASALVPGQTVDDIVLQAGDRVLVFQQTDKTENGVYESQATPVRSSDMNESLEFSNAVASVNEGTQYAGTTWRCETSNPVLGVTEISFVTFGSGTPDATTTVKGKMAFATDQEAIDGAATQKALTPYGMNLITGPIKTQLEKLIPAPPQDLAGLNLLMTLYTAKEAGTGTVVSNLTDDTTPDGSVTDFYDGDAGVLTAEIDSVDEGNKTLSTSSDVGVYGALHITVDEDPYAGQSGKEGFYKQLSAFIRATVALAVGQHTYQLKHSLTGNSALLTFKVDDPQAVTTAIDQVVLPALTRYVSGVPSLAQGDGLTIDVTILDAVKTHYRNGFIGRIDEVGAAFNSLELTPGSVPSTDDPVVFNGNVLSIVAGKYLEDLTVSVIGINSRGQVGAATQQAIQSRVDTKSDESIRVISGSGQYPASGYGGVYNSSQDLKSTYTEELQLLDKKFQRPAGNYTGNQPTAGPDYSTGMGAGDRWVTFRFDNQFTSNSGFTLNLINASGFAGEETPDVKIYIKVEGVTGWLDANKAYPGVGSPSADGDAAMVFAQSTGTEKRVTFGGTTRTGTLYVRIGLPDGSVKNLENVTITDIA